MGWGTREGTGKGGRRERRERRERKGEEGEKGREEVLGRGRTDYEDEGSIFTGSIIAGNGVGCVDGHLLISAI